MDVLSNVLQVTNLETHVAGTREFVAPWSIVAAASDRAAVHIVAGGGCWLRVHGAEPVRLSAGDVVLLANGDSHALSSDRDPREPEAFEQTIARAQNHVVMPLHGRPDPGVQPTLLQSATYQFAKEGPHPLLALLPPLIRIPAEQASQDPELQAVLRLLSQEA